MKEGMRRLRRVEICVLLLADDDAWARVKETLFFGGCCCVDGDGALSALEVVRIKKGGYGGGVLSCRSQMSGSRRW